LKKEMLRGIYRYMLFERGEAIRQRLETEVWGDILEMIVEKGRIYS